MSKDIRSFFAPIKKTAGSTSSGKNDVGSAKKEKKRVFNVSDSDEEEDFVPKANAKKVKLDQTSKKPKTPSPKKIEAVKKSVEISDFFGKSPIHQKPQTLIKPSENKPTKHTAESSHKDRKKGSRRSKKQSKAEDLDGFFDDDFDDAVNMLIEDEIMGFTPLEKKPSVEIKDEKIAKESVKTPKEEPNLSHSNKKSPNKTERKVTPCKTKADVIEASPRTPKNANIDKTPSDSDHKRKANAEAYQRFLSRGGPRNPGSKPIPKGTPTCLKGKTFTITGVLESLERDEAAELITKCGGRVTSSVSKKTSYIVIGDEPGESKLKKAQQYSIPQLTEDALLGLIRSLESNTPEKAAVSEKRKDNEVKGGACKKLKTEGKKLTFNSENSPGVNGNLKSDCSSSGIGSSIESDHTPMKDSSHCRSSKVASKPSGTTSTSLIAESSDSGHGSLKDAKNTKPDVSPIRSQPAPHALGDTLWVEKYKPKSTKNIIGQNGEKSNVKKLTKWLTDWQKHHGSSDKKKTGRPAPWAQSDDGSYYKASLLSGPPGVGKTTTVHLVCQELGYDVIEFNASDTRSKRLLTERVAELLGSKSIKNFYSGGDSKAKRHVLVMDEVDGMAGNEDRGGVQELIQLIKNTKVPIVCMCNDRSHPKMRSLVNYCFDLRFNRPRVEQIKGAMLSICCKEGIKIPADALNDMILSSNQDVRQVLHNLSLWTVRDKSLTAEQVKTDSEKAKKYLKLGPWDVARKVFSSTEQANMTLRQKEDLFFQDYSLGPLFVQDTYIHCKPYKANGDKKKTLELLSRAADSLTWGDVVERTIRSQNAWSLLPVQAIFSSVVPGFEMSGHVTKQIMFPAWLGKNSKRGRLDRLLQELNVHTRLRTSGSKKAMNLDYSYTLRDHILKPLIEEGTGGVPKSLEVMQAYQLLREDLDSLVELCQWPGRKDLYASIDSKVKAAFTRAYNKESPATPYAATFSVKKSKVDESELLAEAVEGDGEDVLEDEEENSIAADAMIKKGKATSKKIKKDQAGTSGESKNKKGSKGSKK